MRPKCIYIAPAVADRDGVCKAQSAAGAGSLTINGALATGGVATLATPRHVSVYAAGDNSGVTFTVTGTDRMGDALTESITGPNATTVKGEKNFATVTTVAVDAATTGNVEVGSADEFETQWVPVDVYQSPPSYSVYRSSGASMTHNVQYTLDAILTTNEHSVEVASVGEANADQVGTFNEQAITAVRLAVTAFASGTANFRVVQST